MHDFIIGYISTTTKKKISERKRRNYLEVGLGKYWGCSVLLCSALKITLDGTKETI